MELWQLIIMEYFGETGNEIVRRNLEYPKVVPKKKSVLSNIGLDIRPVVGLAYSGKSFIPICKISYNLKTSI